jgi:hypothetical protein
MSAAPVAVIVHDTGRYNSRSINAGRWSQE